MESSITIKTISIPEVEQIIISLQEKYKDEIPMQAKHDAGKDHVITKQEYAITVTNPIQGECQEAINAAKQHGQLWAHIVNANEYEQQTAKECQDLQFKINEKDREKKALENKKALIQLDPLKFKYGWLFFAIAGFVAAADGSISYSSFRHVYSWSSSLIYAIVTAAMIMFTHYAYTPWILKSKSRTEKLIKGSIILALAFIAFYAIAVLRVQAINDTIHITVAPVGSLIQQTSVSPLMICIISFVFFLCVFFSSFRFWKNKVERLQWEAYKNLQTEIKKAENEKQKFLAKKKTLEASVIEKKQDVRLRTNYIKEAIERIKSIGEKFCNEYKRSYAQYRNSIPDFFIEPVDLTYDDNLNLFDPKN